MRIFESQLVSGLHAENQNEENIGVEILKILQFVDWTAASIMRLRLYIFFILQLTASQERSLTVIPSISSTSLTWRG